MAKEFLDRVAPKHRPAVHDLGSDHIGTIAGRGLLDPTRLQEIRELRGSVLAHVAEGNCREPCR